jgi:hypothetical protein
MADTARWVKACSPALGWKPGEFVELLRTEREHHGAQALGQWAIWPNLQFWVHWKSPCRESTVQGLLFSLNAAKDFKDRPWDWPKTAKALGDELRRHQEGDAAGRLPGGIPGAQ